MSLAICLDPASQTISLESFTTEFDRNSVIHANRMGELLLQAKAEVKKSKISWEEWLKTSCPVISNRAGHL